MKIIKQAILSAALIVLSMLFSSTTFGQTTNAIGVSFTWTGYGQGAHNLAPTDAAGVVPVSNWNNLAAAGTSGANQMWSGFTDGAGNASAVTLTVSGVNDGWYTQTGDNNCVNGTLMYDLWKPGFENGSYGNSQTVDNGITCVFSNLTAGVYFDAYVYLNNNSSANWGHVTADGGNTRYYFNEDANSGSDYTCTGGFFTASLTNDSVGYPNVNYVKIPAVQVAGDGTVTVIVTCEANSGNTLGVSGLQLIPLPPLAVATASESVYTNGVGVFTAATSGGAPPYTYQWYQASGGMTNAITDGTGTNAIYYTPPATSDMNGYGYYVAVTDSLNSTATSSTAILTVLSGEPSVISVQLEPNDSPFQPLVPTDITGAFGVSNWNAQVVATDGSTQNFTGLIDMNGVGSPVQLTVLGASDGWHAQDPAPDSAPITKLLNTFVKGKTPANPGDPDTLGNGLMQFVVTNLDDTQTYNIYVYMLDNSTINLPDVDGGNGDTNYAGNLFTTVSETSSFVASVNQNPAGPRDSGNYVHLTGLTPTDGAITISVAWDTNSTGDGVGVSGLQIVNAALDLSPVSLVSSPASQRVLTNTPATFSVSATGTPIFYQWYEISGGVTNSIPDATSYSYTVLSSDAISGTGYFVTVSNQLNMTNSATAILTTSHLVAPVTRFLENDEFNTGTWSSTADALAQIYPGSPWLSNNAPDTVEFLQAFDDNQDLQINSAERIYGYFTPPVTGNYIFYVASDDSAALWLSTNNDPANVYEIAQNQGWMYHDDWTLSQSCGETTYGGGGEYRSDSFELGGGQNSVVPLTTVNGGSWAAWPGLNGDGSITLTAGTPYYIELDHWQGNGGQAASVTYKLAGQSDPTYQSAPLLAYGNLSAVQALDGDGIVITNQPVDATALEGLSTSFSVTAGSYATGAPATTPPIEYQWFMISGGVTNSITGANSATYSTQPEVLGNNGQQFYCQLTTIAYQTNSSVATLTVVPSNVKPAIAEIGGTVSTLFVTWNELLDSASAVNLANYSINGGATILSAIATNIVSSPYAATVVTLTIANAVAGANYTLTANNIENLPLSQTNAPNTQATFLAYDAFLDFNEGAATDSSGLASVNLTGGINGAGAVDLSIPSGGQGWVLINDPISGAPVTNFTATFKLFIGPFANNNNNNPAGLGDGVSFNFGGSGSIYWPGAPAIGSLADGLSGANVLAVNFKPYNGSTLLGVNVSYGGTALTNVPLTQTTLVNSRWVDITIQLNADGTVDVDRDGIPLVNGLALPGYAQVSSGTFLLGASCGGYWEQQNLDDVAILENAPLPPAVINLASSGGNLGISWVPAGGRLQTATSLTGSWTDVGGSQHFVVPIGNGTAFYRVVVP